MNTDARLLAEAEPEPGQTPEPPKPPAPGDPNFSAKDWIVSQSLVHGGVPEPAYYRHLFDRLEGRNKRKLEYSTYLLLQADGTITVRFHTTDIITARPDGVVIVNTYGTPNPKQMHVRTRWGYRQPGYGTAARSWRKPITRNRIADFLPSGWNIYAHGKSSLPSSTAMVGGKRGDQNWWWQNSHSGSGRWDGPGLRIPFSDYDQIDTNSGELKARAQPVPMKGRGSNPERTSGYGFGGKFYEAKQIPPWWTETGGVFGDFTAWPKVEWYAKCPKCGHVHGNYKTMREAHLKRLCQLCDMEQIDRVKDAVAHADDPGMTPQKVLRMVGEAEPIDVRAHILSSPKPWVTKAKYDLETSQGLELKFVDEDVLEQDPDEVSDFELVGGDRRYWVFKDDNVAEAKAVEIVTNQLQAEPEMFNRNFLERFLDTERLRRELKPEESYLSHEDVARQVEKLIEDGFLQEEDFYTPAGKFRKITPRLQNLVNRALGEFLEQEQEDFDPIEFLQEIYGKDEWMAKAFELAPLYGEQLEKAAQAAVDADGWAHFVANYDNDSIDLDGGAVAARMN